MEEVFSDILDMDDVEGVMLVSFNGELLFKKFVVPPADDPAEMELWPHIVKGLNAIREADLVYENKRLYLRRNKLGYLLVLLGHFAQVAKLRLNCDVMVPSLERTAEAKGKRRFFQRWK